MSDDQPSYTHRTITLADLGTLLLRQKKLIIASGVTLAIFLGSWAVTRPITYMTDASFQEKGVQSGSSTSMSGVMGLLTGNLMAQQENTIPLMKSKRLWTPVIKRFGLQATIQEVSTSFPLYHLIKNNIRTELAHFRSVQTPILADNTPLSLTQLFYDGEVPIRMNIQFLNEHSFVISGSQDIPTVEATLDKITVFQGVSFALSHHDQSALTGREFSILISPLDTTAKRLSNFLTLKPDEKSTKTLKLSFIFPHRKTSSTILNALMQEYQNYLKEEHQQVAAAQLAYLENRKQESSDNLQKVILGYAAQISLDLPSSGIVDSEKELELLEQQKAVLRQSLMTIDLELNRLERNRKGDGYLDTLGASAQLPELVRQTIASIHELKQRRDRLVLALSKMNTERTEQTQLQFEEKIATLEQIGENIERMDRLYHIVSIDEALPPLDQIEDAPMLKLWYEKLGKEGTYSEQAWNEHKANFLGYLNHYLRMSRVQQRLLQERLALPQEVDEELQGADLTTAAAIYLDLTQRLNDTQAEVRQNTFIIDQVQDQSFEISSLSGTLKDPVSQGIIERYCSLSLGLKDSTIRSPKELDRIREELSQSRVFLLYHLQQATQLLKLREEFLSQKIYSIQSVMLDLIQQQVSVLEKHLQDYTLSHVEQLKQQRELLNQLLQDINQQMASLPFRWGSEQMIKHQAKISGAIMEEVSKLVETKNIAHHLETIQSSPLDFAVPPILPRRPNLALFLVLGFILGSGLGAAYVIGDSMIHGMRVSETNLKLFKQHVGGKLADGEIVSTLRRIASFLCCGEESNCLLLLTGKGPDYSHALASLLAKKGLRSLCINLSFDEPLCSNGLLQAIEGSVDSPQVISKGSYDIIAAGGTTIHGHELLHHPRFHELLNQFSDQYDWVITSYHGNPLGAEAESLSKRFDRIAVTVCEEKIDDLNFYVELAANKRLIWTIYP